MQEMPYPGCLIASEIAQNKTAVEEDIDNVQYIIRACDSKMESWYS